MFNIQRCNYLETLKLSNPQTYFAAGFTITDAFETLFML